MFFTGCQGFSHNLSCVERLDNWIFGSKRWHGSNTTRTQYANWTGLKIHLLLWCIVLFSLIVSISFYSILNFHTPAGSQVATLLGQVWLLWQHTWHTGIAKASDQLTERQKRHAFCSRRWKRYKCYFHVFLSKSQQSLKINERLLILLSWLIYCS